LAVILAWFMWTFLCPFPRLVLVKRRLEGEGLTVLGLLCLLFCTDRVLH